MGRYTHQAIEGISSNSFYAGESFFIPLFGIKDFIMIKFNIFILLNFLIEMKKNYFFFN